LTRYHTPADLPRRIPVFPLRGGLLLPRCTLPLNIFEPRYLALIDDVLSGDRLIGIVQPRLVQEDVESPQGKAVALRAIGGVGKLTAFQETDDGRYLVTLTGLTRFTVLGEVVQPKPYRVCDLAYAAYPGDFVKGFGEEAVNRQNLLDVLKAYLEAQDMKADWDSIMRSSTEFLVNALSMMSPYGPEEKQALLEAPDLKTRSEILVALAEMQMATPGDGSGSALQ
jgi:uncharacterized protein